MGLRGPHELHYTEWGSRRSSHAIVCVHGYSGNSRDFDELARTLAPDSRIVCVDVAGRGESAWLGSPLEYHFGQFLGDINVLFGQLGVKSVDWVGTSMGGLLGMVAAGLPRTRIRRLVMNDVGAFLPIDALRKIGRNLRAPERFATIRDVETHLRQTHREWGELTTTQWRHIAFHGSRRIDDHYRLHYDPQITRLVEPIPFTPGLFFWDAWYKVKCPVLLLRGETSEVFPREVADTMLRVRSDAKLVEIPGCGHAPSLMQPEQIEIVGDFLSARSAKMPQAWRMPFPSSPSSRPAF